MNILDTNDGRMRNIRKRRSEPKVNFLRATVIAVVTFSLLATFSVAVWAAYQTAIIIPAKDAAALDLRREHELPTRILQVDDGAPSASYGHVPGCFHPGTGVGKGTGDYNHAADGRKKLDR